MTLDKKYLTTKKAKNRKLKYYRNKAGKMKSLKPKFSMFDLD